MKCPNCNKEKHGELQTVCKHCGHCEGSDRWFSEEEITNVRLVNF